MIASFDSRLMAAFVIGGLSLAATPASGAGLDPEKEIAPFARTMAERHGLDPTRVHAILAETVVFIDPLQNPDGRARFVHGFEAARGLEPDADPLSAEHVEPWPSGRVNHYLFDMNRDWMVGSQPETRGRWKAVLEFHPHLFVDAHEMGSLDTFLFYPQEKPLNPHFPERHAFWHGEFAADAAAAFDERGWGYYTREWADGWAPFYSDAWSSLIGAIGLRCITASFICAWIAR